MGKRWEEPSIEVQQFVANEYVAACWIVKCGVPDGHGYTDMDGDGKLSRGDHLHFDWWGERFGCGKEAVVQADSIEELYNARWLSDSDWGRGWKDQPVYHWVDGNGISGNHYAAADDIVRNTAKPNAS